MLSYWRDEEGGVYEKIQVSVPGVRVKFEEWIKEQGGVQVWQNISLLDPGGGPAFTPALDFDTKKPYPQPNWSLARGEVITDINRFLFIND